MLSPTFEIKSIYAFSESAGKHLPSGGKGRHKNNNTVHFGTVNLEINLYCYTWLLARFSPPHSQSDYLIASFGKLEKLSDAADKSNLTLGTCGGKVFPKPLDYPASSSDEVYWHLNVVWSL